MTDVGTVGTAASNTESCRVRSRHFTFTFNNPEDHGCPDHGTLAQVFRVDGAKNWIFQLERGETCGTPHYQGYVGYENPRDFTVMKKLVKGWHVETVKFGVLAAINYGMKEKTHVAGPWAQGIKLPEKIRVVTELRPFQQRIVDLCSTEPDDRTIHWFWEPDGNIGKTALAKYLCVNFKALFLSGKANDIKSAIVAYTKQHGAPKVCIFHFVRTVSDFISYEALESVKDGIFFSGKYESSMFMMNSPHVICLANFEPEYQALSADRWNIERI